MLPEGLVGFLASSQFNFVLIDFAIIFIIYFLDHLRIRGLYSYVCLKLFDL